MSPLFCFSQNSPCPPGPGLFSYSKSLVHKDVTERLAAISPGLWRQVRAVLEKNRDERHLRGGAATRAKYESLREHPGR